MLSEKAIKNSFQRVKQDMVKASESIQNVESTLRKTQENSQEWFLAIIRREEQMQKRIAMLEEKLHRMESMLQAKLH